MSYWNIRKRVRLNHLPPPDPELVRAGVGENDQNLLRSRKWLEIYYEEKGKRPDGKSKETSSEGVMAHDDAPGGSGREEGPQVSSEASAGRSVGFAPR